MKYAIILLVIVIGIIAVTVSVTALICVATNNPIIEDILKMFHK